MSRKKAEEPPTDVAMWTEIAEAKEGREAQKRTDSMRPLHLGNAMPRGRSNLASVQDYDEEIDEIAISS